VFPFLLVGICVPALGSKCRPAGFQIPFGAPLLKTCHALEFSCYKNCALTDGLPAFASYCWKANAKQHARIGQPSAISVQFFNEQIQVQLVFSLSIN
jgi:hypothetical protein